MPSVTRSLVLDIHRLAAVEQSGLRRTPPEEAFDRLTRLAARVLDVPMAFLTVLDDRDMFFKSRVGVDVSELPVEESFCQYVVDDQDAFVTGTAAVDPRTMHNPSIDSLGIAAYAGVPFRGRGGQVLGAFCVADSHAREWSREDIETLSVLADVATNEVMLRESCTLATQFATTLQRSLLPPIMPTVPGVDLAATFVPADDGFGVLGDFYDVFESEPGRWHLMIGDVRGHGPPAAETVSLARWTVRAECSRRQPPADVLRALNRQMQARPSPDAPHLTCLLAGVRVVEDAVEVEVAGAGHPPALVRRRTGTVEILPAGGQMLGVIDNPSPATTTVRLQPGDIMVLLTDGVTEAGRTRDHMLGHTGVATALMAPTAGRSAQHALDTVLQAVAEVLPGPPFDDIAAVALACPTSGGTLAARSAPPPDDDR